MVPPYASGIFKMRKHLQCSLEGGPTTDGGSSSLHSSSSSRLKPESIEMRSLGSPSAPPVGYSKQVNALKTDETEESLGSLNIPPRDKNNTNFVGWLRRKSGAFWMLSTLHLMLLLLGLCGPAAAEPVAFEELHLSVFNTSLLQQQQQQQQKDFAAASMSPRRLSSAAAWAAEVEGALRLSPRLSLYLGIFLTLAGSLLMAGGSTLMKLGLSVQDDAALGRQSCDQQWLWGFAAYVAGACLHVIALMFAPASVLSPMNSIGLIANAVASATVLKEPFGFQELLFTGGCAFGVFLCACASVLPRTEFVDMGSDVDIRYIGLYSWRDPWYLAFLGVCCGLGFGALVYLNSVESALLEEREQQLLRETEREIRFVGIQQGLEAQKDGAAELAGSGGHAKQSLYPRLVGLCYGFLAGLVGSQCILEVKEIGTCVRYGLTHSSIWFSLQPYLASCFLGLSVWMQIHFLNLGLARGDATTIVPTYYVVWTFFGTLGGFAKFHEVQGFSAGALVLFGLGFGLTAMCIILLAVEEMQNLRKYVDQQVPEYDEEAADLATQDLVDQRLSTRVTFAMGMFPVSSLGRTAGRRRFRPIYQRFRRTRSTASDTALGDAYGELTVGSASLAGAYTLPPNIHFLRRSVDACAPPPTQEGNIPLQPVNRLSSGIVRSLELTSRVSRGSMESSCPLLSPSEETRRGALYGVSRLSPQERMHIALRSSFQSQRTNSP